jgi:cysteinyl-tRNA synthetase
MLSVHYRNPINFTEDLLESAKNSFNRIKTAYQNLEHRKQSSMNLVNDADNWMEKINSFKQEFENAMDDDFNTANAISVLFDITKEANQYIQQDQTQAKVIDAFQAAMETFLHILGLEAWSKDELLDEEIEALIEERNEARKSRNFARADEIRDQLKEKNIILEDTPQGVRWKRG